MQGKMEAYTTSTQCLLMYEAHFPINKLLRRSLTDKHVKNLLEFALFFEVPSHIWDEVDRYFSDGGRMPKWDICQNKLVFQSNGRQANISFQQLLLKEKMELKNDLYHAQISISPYLKGEIKIDPSYFTPIEEDGPVGIEEPPAQLPIGQPPRRSKYMRCENCILLNPGNKCAVHKTKVASDHSCSRFQPITIYFGGSVSPK